MSKVRSVKRQIDAKRQEKAKAKRERRQGGGRPGETLEVDEADETLTPLTEAEFLTALQDATTRFEAGEIDFDEFDDTKNGLFARLQQ